MLFFIWMVRIIHALGAHHFVYVNLDRTRALLPPLSWSFSHFLFFICSLFSFFCSSIFIFHFLFFFLIFDFLSSFSLLYFLFLFSVFYFKYFIFCLWFLLSFLFFLSFRDAIRSSTSHAYWQDSISLFCTESIQRADSYGHSHSTFAHWWERSKEASEGSYYIDLIYLSCLFILFIYLIYISDLYIWFIYLVCSSCLFILFIYLVHLSYLFILFIYLIYLVCLSYLFLCLFVYLNTTLENDVIMRDPFLWCHHN